MSKIGLLVVGSLMMFASVVKAEGGTMPYCAASSQMGVQYWSWTHATLQEDCAWVEQKVRDQGYQVDYETNGYYSTDLSKINYGTLSCNTGTYYVQGYGAAVFDMGVQLIRTDGLRGCTITITN